VPVQGHLTPVLLQYTCPQVFGDQVIPPSPLTPSASAIPPAGAQTTSFWVRQLSSKRAR
jgi:hypothetical protein